MKRLPNLTSRVLTNIPGLELVRVINVKDIIIPSELEIWMNFRGELTSDRVQISTDGCWTKIPLEIGSGSYVEIEEKTQQGVANKKELSLSIPSVFSSKRYLLEILKAQHWVAIVIDSNEVPRLVGSPAQPLKFKTLKQSTSPNLAEITLGLVSQYPAPYLSTWRTDELWGNPQDFGDDNLYSI